MRTAAASVHAGVEWLPVSALALRGGLRSDAVKELGGPAGWTLGFGLRLMGQQLDYAWVPYGGLGATHVFSLVISFAPLEGRRDEPEAAEWRAAPEAAEPLEPPEPPGPPLPGPVEGLGGP